MKYLGLPLLVTRLKRINFQTWEDRVAAKLVPWIGKHATIAVQTMLVKPGFTSIVIYYITVLNVPVEVLMKIDNTKGHSVGLLVTRSPEESAKLIEKPFVSQRNMEDLES
jgi:hypothetical protein